MERRKYEHLAKSGGVDRRFEIEKYGLCKRAPGGNQRAYRSAGRRTKAPDHCSRRRLHGAGCGCSNTKYGLVPQFLRLLAKRMNRNVEWNLVGKFGATLTRVRYRLLPTLEGSHWDVLILCAGSNDLMAFRPADEKWKKELKESIEMAKGLADKVIVFSSAEVYMVPAFGRSLQNQLKKATLYQAKVAQEVCEANGAFYVNQTVGTPHGDTKWFWCSDCFHPSYEGYRVIANCLINHFSDSRIKELASLGLKDCKD
ncbi:MAG: SGNH/GDSL hydrolase family protein [Aeriscardovia sp.]|nr:SGNH/GDSL hydrolase family protein [Aeriscardovia sp.]